MADDKRDADFTIGVGGQAGVSLVTDDDDTDGSESDESESDESESDESESDDSEPDKPSD